MILKSLFSCRHWGKGILLLAMALVISPVKATPKPPVFDVRTSLATPAHISLGEPIIIRCDVANISGRTAVVHMRDCTTDWYAVSVRNASGADVPAAPNAPAIHSEDLRWVGDKTLLDGGTASEYILVSRLKPLAQPGKYEVTVYISLQYAITGDPEAHTLVPHQTPQAQDVKFSVVVTSHDAARLHAIAQQLKTSATSGSSFSRLSMDELFSMPEADVHTDWKELALTPGNFNDSVAYQLQDLHSKTGVDILVQMLNMPGLHYNIIGDCINRAYNQGDPALQDHIKTMAKKDGFEMPEHAPVPAELTPSNGALVGGTLF